MTDFLQVMFHYIQTFNISIWDVADIAIVAYVIYRILILVRRSRTAQVAKAILLLLIALALAAWLPLRVVYLAVSLVGMAFGISLSNHCKLPIIPTDLFPRELADITGIPYPKIKIGFDVICLAVTAGLTLGFLHHLEGLGIGTIAAAFTMGKAIGFAGDVLDKHFRFGTYKTLKKESC